MTTEREFREYESVRPGRSRMGRTEDLVTCPFCGDEVWTYRWSRWGSGKRCRCGALLGGYGATRKVSP
jgi:hypothetical protein